MEFSSNVGSSYYYAGIASSIASLYVTNSSLNLIGNLYFYSNDADVTALECYKSFIQLVGELELINNSQAYSGIILRPDSVMNIVGSMIVKNNRVYDSVIRTELSSLSMSGNSTFAENFGAPSVTSRYQSNTIFKGITKFLNNSGILFGLDSDITFSGNSSFISNNIGKLFNRGAIRVYGGNFRMLGQYLFERNSVNRVEGGVLNTLNAGLMLEGNGRFVRNSASTLYLQDAPRIQIAAGTELLFEENNAYEGSILHISGILHDIFCTNGQTDILSLCFVQTETPYPFIFRNNTALNGGSLMHIDFLQDLNVLNVNINTSSLDMLTSADQGGNSNPLIASNSFRLCFCENETPVCNLTTIEQTVSRGEQFTVSVAALTLFGYNLPRTVNTYLSGDPDAVIGTVQKISSNCTALEYRVYSPATSERLVIAAAQPCNESPDIIDCLEFTVSLDDCPRGSVFAVDRCICDSRLSDYTQDCNPDSGALSKEKTNFWIGVHLDENDLAYIGLILYSLCPFDYCLPPPVDIDLNNPDSQCNNHRSGILCGQCKGNKSLIIGDLECSDCSNISLLLIIPMALLGIGLVIFLFLTQLTVTSGVVNGLVLYANILSTNGNAFKLRDVYGLRVFIAWVNLDFGIPACFYNGMTYLTYTAWQFAFPLYLLFLVAFIIILCHYSIRVSMFLGKTHPVAVLATLILLSYNKLFGNILTILTPATLQYPHESNIHSIVWLYDGNVAFAQGGHGVLVIIALIALIFLFLPFTLVLVSAQWLQRNNTISRCLNKFNLSHSIKHFHEPYKPATRYWLGLCLLLRIVIQITLVSTSSNNLSAQLLAISTICTILISIISMARGIYSNRWLDVLEISYIFNLGVLSVMAYHIELAGGNQVIATYISTSVVFLTFLGIIVAVLIHRIKKSQRLNIFKRASRTKNLNADVEESKVTSQEVFLAFKEKDMELRETLLTDN